MRELPRLARPEARHALERARLALVPVGSCDIETPVAMRAFEFARRLIAERLP